jgi:hypothetical protein
MDLSTSSPKVVGVTKPTFACIRCFERKVKCDKQNPCTSCVRHNVQCISRESRPPRRIRKIVQANIVDEKLKRYEALLREKGIDPNQVPSTSEAGRNRQPEVREQPAQLSATLNPKEPQKTVFMPVLLQGQKGTQLVDKYVTHVESWTKLTSNSSLWSRIAEEVRFPIYCRCSHNGSADVLTLFRSMMLMMYWKRIPGTIQAKMESLMMTLAIF